MKKNNGVMWIVSGMAGYAYLLGSAYREKLSIFNYLRKDDLAITTLIFFTGMILFGFYKIWLHKLKK
jgi:hypothetical protein